MPYRNLSLEDFARYIGMDVQRVRHLADRGKLPGQKVGGEWRFHQARVTEWLQQEMPSLDESRLIALEHALRGSGQDTDLLVTGMISLEGINIAMAANSKTSVLRELVRLADRTGLLYDVDGLLEALEERETMCSTALANGVAIPHPRQPMPYASADPFICVARLSSGVWYGSPYRDVTRLFFLICSHEDRHHLRTLARLVRILDGDMIDQLMQVDSPEELLQMLITKEQQIVAVSGR